MSTEPAKLGDKSPRKYRKNALTAISHLCDIAVEGDVPQTQVVFYASDDGSAPLLVWIDGLPMKVQNKCIVRIERLAQLGHELRRPEADLLRDDIHELRVRVGNVHYRILYFFHGGQAILSHGCSKEDIVPPVEIDRAVANKTRFIKNPARHTYRE